MKLRYEGFLNNDNVKSITGKALDDFVIIAYKNGKEVNIFPVDYFENNFKFLKSVCDEWKYYTTIRGVDKEC